MVNVQLKHISASSVSQFVACPAKWLTSYDPNTKIIDRSAKSDAGVLTHGALELWRNPANGHDQTYETLERCYQEFAAHQKLAETMDVYVMGLGFLKKAYALAKSHPTLPMHLAQTIGVEVNLLGSDGETWHPDGFPIPIKGSIDNLMVITPFADRPAEVILCVEDYKTGKSKEWSELTGDDVQPPMYLWYATEVLKPHLEAQGYTVLRVALIWTYIASGISVNMYESDFDLENFRGYIQSISNQMLALTKSYNVVCDEAAKAGPEIGPRKIAEFLAKHEKVNYLCSFCSRKNVCRNFQRALAMEKTIDIASADWAQIVAERDRASAMAKYGEDRRKEIDELIRTHLDREKLDIFQYSEGRELTANQTTNRWHDPKVLLEFLGPDFIIAAAEITQSAVESEIARIALTDSDRSNELRAALNTRMLSRPGARIVRTRNIPKAPKKKVTA